mmetsp:Transcript_25978/g.55286  ORF Transcript_25978/g.55286 Transcript_25978/m.55286 type:complete len:88 (-) Transcript_25978:7-270(-)
MKNAGARPWRRRLIPVDEVAGNIRDGRVLVARGGENDSTTLREGNRIDERARNASGRRAMMLLLLRGGGGGAEVEEEAAVMVGRVDR